ncbi:MAG: phospholipase [Pseudomonadota bacterium]
MRLIFVHGWSVTNTDTYGGMPEALSNASGLYGLNLDIQHIHLGKYISFHDEVTMDDIARAMDRALRDLPGNSDAAITPFSCITHSTGGPVVRFWVDKFYGSQNLNKLPLDHLIMLAPANHGSALATIGKARVGRIKAWFNGIEPGQRVLDWLSLGSDGQWELNEKYLNYNYVNNGFYPFVLTGQGIDHKFYDFLNSYLVEKGSDGVIRVAGASMNYRYISLVQDMHQIIRQKPLTYKLVPDCEIRKPNPTALGVYGYYCHSGSKMGIMRSVKKNETNTPIIKDILKCLKVKNPDDYQARANELSQLTLQEQSGGDRYCMMVFNIRDDQGEQIKKDDYDLFLLAGNQYRPHQLPQGFFMDKQMNNETGKLVYYLDANKMAQIKDGKFGVQVVARPSKGFSYYTAAEFRSEGTTANSILTPNQTTYVDIKLHRLVDKNVFRFGPVTDKPVSFKKIKPSGEPV